MPQYGSSIPLGHLEGNWQAELVVGRWGWALDGRNEPAISIKIIKSLEGTWSGHQYIFARDALPVGQILSAWLLDKFCQIHTLRADSCQCRGSSCLGTYKARRFACCIMLPLAVVRRSQDPRKPNVRAWKWTTDHLQVKWISNEFEAGLGSWGGMTGNAWCTWAPRDSLFRNWWHFFLDLDFGHISGAKQSSGVQEACSPRWLLWIAMVSLYMPME